MTERTKFILMSATLIALLLPAVAQNSTAPSQPAAPTQTASPVAGQATTPAQTTTPVATPPKSINQRKDNQQGRIANGVADGQLTAGEAGALEKKETQLNQEERAMKAEDNGHLTQADRTALHQQQNQLSNQIYKDKHNAAVENVNKDQTNRAGQRAENQQDRIANGIKNDQLSAGQAAHLENQESAINQEVKADRQLNGGKLTQQEKAQVNRQQNHLSKQIYKDKHNHK